MVMEIMPNSSKWDIEKPFEDSLVRLFSGENSYDPNSRARIVISSELKRKLQQYIACNCEIENNEIIDVHRSSSLSECGFS